MDIYVLDGNLQRIGLIDAYTSLIWATRYWDLGDCELYLEATQANLELLRINRYLMRPDSDMLCQIKRIELSTDVENGNYLTVTGYDVRRYLQQRIVWGTVTIDGSVEAGLRDLVDASLGSILLMQRSLRKPNGGRLFYLGDVAGLPEATTEQISFRNLWDVVRDHCVKFGWGSKLRLDGERLLFEFYAGTDRRASVIFSDRFENLSATQYIEDHTHLGNVALVAGQGEGPSRSKSTAGSAAGVDRYEIFIDARDVSNALTWEDLTRIYPLIAQGGEGYIASEAGASVYKMRTLNVQIVDANQLSELQRQYPDGVIVTIDDIEYYQISDATIADLPSATPDLGDEVTLRDLIYSVYLLNRGYERLAEFGAVTAFDGSIDPNTTFVYKRDYFLGDLVTVENEFGISAGARITEIIEVHDDSGFHVEPRFEYIEEE